MIRSLTFTCLALVFLSQFSLAMTLSSTERPYYPSEFYRNIQSGQRDTDLKNEIHKILSSVHVVNPGQNDSLNTTCPNNKTCYRHTSLGYGPARRLLFGKLHLEQTNQGYAIRDVYCQQMLTDEDFRSNPPGPGEIPDPNVMNTEHTWPQSRFSGRFEKDLQKSDLHILFPVSTKSNSSRGNIEFGDVVTVTSSPCPKAERGYTARGGRKTFFEVPDAHKGNTARAIFYFSSRYQLPISQEEEDSLKAWHRADPIDHDEVTRNSAIFEQQKGRNPFIDHPELVELISDF